MSYQETMEAAGAQVYSFEYFGSYQGDWWALVTFEGVTGWVHGCYGSCSGCDAFEAEFGYGSHEHGRDYVSTYNFLEKYDEACPTCASLRQRYVDFGREYLDNIMTTEEALSEANRNIEWDSDARDAVSFITKTAQEREQS